MVHRNSTARQIARLSSSLAPGVARDPDGAWNCALNRDQLRACQERPADRHVVLVAPSGLGVDPREVPARRRIVGLVVNRAASVPIKHAPLSLNASAPFAPV